MKLAHTEKLLVNTPMRSFMQRHIPTSYFLAHSSFRNAPFCLELGCGQGAGVEIVINAFHPSRVIALDYDPQQVELAVKRLASPYSPHYSLLVENAASLSFDHSIFDAVFDYGVLHHVAEWREALAEVYRVLKPMGYFFYEDLMRPLLQSCLFEKFFPHPAQAQFSKQEFEEVLKLMGFYLCSSKEWGGCYLLGVAQKP